MNVPAAAAPASGSRANVAPWAVTVLVAGLCWALTIQSIRGMPGVMPMPGGWTMSMAWMVMPGQSVFAAGTMFVTMWLVMMVAMMLPSALPVVLLHRRLAESRRARGVPVAPEVVLLAGYFTAWTAFGAVAFGLGLPVATVAMQSEGVSRMMPLLAGAALMVAGLYQLTPFKRACLAHCRSPLSFFTSSWREGWVGTFRLGVHHGSYCTGCCWALMLIQLTLGVMNLWVMVAVAGVIALEKSWRHGHRVAHAAGFAAVVAGVLHIVRVLG